MKAADALAIVAPMDPAPWRAPTKGWCADTIVCHDEPTVDGIDRVVVHANVHFPYRANLDGVALLRNLAEPLLALWKAVEQRQAARCWSRGPSTADPLCLCGAAYEMCCPCKAADVAVRAAYAALEDVTAEPAR